MASGCCATCHRQSPEVRSSRFRGPAARARGLVGLALHLGYRDARLAASISAVRMNMPNCNGTEALTPTLYHSGRSGHLGAMSSKSPKNSPKTETAST